MPLWKRLPLWLLVDGGVRSLPPAAQLALIHLAANDGFTRCGEDVRGTLDAFAAGAGASLADLIDRGLVEHDGTTLRLIPPPDHATPVADVADESPADESPPASVPPAAPYRRPSQSPEGQRRRKVLSWFNHRAGPCRDVPKSATWEQWSASPEGVALLAVGRPRHRGNTSAGTREHSVPAAREHTGNTPGTHREHTGNTPPQTPPFPEESTKRGEKTPAGTHREHTGNTPTGTREHTSGNTPPRVPATPDTLTGRDAFDALADDARGVADFIGQAYELSAVRMLGAARLTRSEVRALAEALKSPAAWWPKGTRDGVPERVTLKRLAGYPSKSESGGYECGPLSDLIAHVRAKATAPVARPADPAPVFVNLGRNNRPLHRGA